MRITAFPSVAMLVSASMAAPIPSQFTDIYSFSPALIDFYARVSNYIGDTTLGNSPTCSASGITLPAAALAANGLGPVPADQVLQYVAIGHGTQNYTCADSTANSKPAQVGALASLYDVTCMVANFPDLLVPATTAVLDYDLPPEPTPLAPVNALLLGHHYFANSTLPVFNLDTTSNRQFGIAMATKVKSMNAPVESSSSTTDNVPWLFLETIEGTVGNYKSVYRVNTNGGSPPATCEGQSSSFQVPYSADYYFYVSS